MSKPQYRSRLLKKLTESETVGLTVIATAVSLAKKAARETNDFEAGVELVEIERLLTAAKAQEE
jgi:hypothetical protein